MSFSAEDGGQVSSATLDVLPQAPINLGTSSQSGQIIYFGTEQTSSNSVEASALAGNTFVKWVIVEDGTETDITPGTPVTKEMTFLARFEKQTYTLTFEGVQDQGSVSKTSLTNIAYGTKIELDGNDIFFGESKGTDNYVSPVPNTGFSFVE